MSNLDEQADKLLDANRLLRIVPAAGFDTADLQMPEDTVQGLVPAEVTTLLSGHGGSGKSQFALVLLAHVAANRPWAGLPVRGGRVLLVTLEDTASRVKFRLRQIVAEYSLPAADVAENTIILDGTESGAALAFEVNEAGVRQVILGPALAEVEAAARGCVLVIVDNSSDAYAANENDRQQVRTFMHELTRVARKNGAGLILLAHIDKAAARNGGNGSTFSGSTAWHNSARSRLVIADNNGRPQLLHEKANWGKPRAPIALEWSGEGVLVPAGRDSGSRLAADAIQAEADAAALLTAFLEAEAREIDVPCGRSGPLTTWHILSTVAGFPKELRNRAERQRFWTAIDLLATRGRIFRETFRDSRRHVKQKWRTRAGTVADAPVDAQESARHTSPHTPLSEPAQGHRCASSGIVPHSGIGADTRKPAQTCTADEYLSARG